MPIILLNGAPRSGKSSIATAIQESFPGVWMAFGVDAVMDMTPGQYRPGMGLRPGETPGDPSPRVFAEAWATAASVFNDAGLNVVADLGIHDRSTWALILKVLAPRQVLTVGVVCPLDEVVRRREATGWEPPHAEKAKLWQDAVHEGREYDVVVDTSVLSAKDAAVQIRDALLARNLLVC